MRNTDNDPRYRHNRDGMEEAADTVREILESMRGTKLTVNKPSVRYSLDSR